MGAEDYLPKPFNPVLLRARLNSSLQKKKLRDLRKIYLQQEVTLRQSEKLATLGRLSAGMAHELNNPAAAAQRGAAQLQADVHRPAADQSQAGQAGSERGAAAGAAGPRRAGSGQGQATGRSWMRSPAATGKRELEAWLDEQGVAMPGRLRRAGEPGLRQG